MKKLNDFEKLKEAFRRNGLTGGAAVAAAIAYRNVDLELDGSASQDDYNEAIREEMTYWEE